MKDLYKNLIEIVVTSYWGGILCLVVGCLLIIESYKERKNPSDFYLIGWYCAIASFLTGILILIMKILGKW